VDSLARALDLHILASGGGEAFPNAVAETMLSGTPSVVTDVGDCAYLVGGSGWTVPPRNPEAMAEAIRQAHEEWRDDPAKWADRGADARQRIVDNFSIDRMISAYEEVWRSVASGRSQAQPAAA
jgi:glycosyltransferase involved in cell wall biosynthesis